MGRLGCTTCDMPQRPACWCRQACPSANVVGSEHGFHRQVNCLARRPWLLFSSLLFSLPFRSCPLQRLTLRARTHSTFGRAPRPCQPSCGKGRPAIQKLLRGTTAPPLPPARLPPTGAALLAPSCPRPSYCTAIVACDAASRARSRTIGRPGMYPYHTSAPGNMRASLAPQEPRAAIEGPAPGCAHMQAGRCTLPRLVDPAGTVEPRWACQVVLLGLRSHRSLDCRRRRDRSPGAASAHMHGNPFHTHNAVSAH